MRLQSEVVVITGGAGLIGKAFVMKILNEGGRVIIADKNVEEANRYIANFSDEKRANCIIVAADITSAANIEQLIQEGCQQFGKITALVNNAYPRNTSYGNTFYEVSYESFCENISFNIGGYFLCCQKFSKYFEQQGFGNIINIASIYGVTAPRFEIYHDLPMTMPVEYAAIKSAIIHLTKYIAKFLKGKNIRINCISPGGIEDNHHFKFLEAYKKHCLNKGMLNAKDLCGALLFLLSEDSRYVNGQNLVVDDGFTL